MEEVHEGEPVDPGAVQTLVHKILDAGVDGVGPLKGARQLADEHLAAHADPEKAIDRLIATHTRIVGAAGFAAGVGGLPTLAFTIPADLTVFYALSARCVAGIAHLRGYDINSDEVRSVVLLTLIGSAGAVAAAEVGIQIGNKASMAALRKLPGSALIAINKKVGFRLLTKFGERGAVNLVKIVPVVGGGVGATVNATALRSISRYAKKNFPLMEPLDALPGPEGPV
ncbi:MAG TPA: EcsC family protein [Frankiaceae bacterium]|nr:EcsC family protein [Frankiaceae bacterium]